MLGFRVWDMKNKSMNRMASSFYLDSYGDLCEELTGRVTEVLKNYIAMQSTGIFDFQDKEIFEGDMLFIYIDTPEFSNHYYLVESAKDFLLMMGKLGDSVRKISNDGNVYEQPQLLEKIKC